MDKYISFYSSTVPFISGTKYRITGETPTHYVSLRQNIPKAKENVEYVTGEIVTRLDVRM